MNKMLKKLAGMLLLSTIVIGCGKSVVTGDMTDSNVNTEENDTKADSLITVGFSQLGAESDWRSANTESMLGAFTEENMCFPPLKLNSLYCNTTFRKNPYKLCNFVFLC